MTDTEFRLALAHIGYSQKQFATSVGRNADAVSRWARGHQPVPAWVPLVIELLRYRAAMAKDAAE